MSETIFRDQYAKAKYSYDASYDNGVPILRFHDFDGFLEHCKDRPHLLASQKNDSRRVVPSVSCESFHSHKTFEEALHDARFGWAEGYERIKRQKFELKHLIKGDYDTYYRLSNEGDVIDMQSYLEGSPDCWMEEEIDYDSEKPGGKVAHLRVSVNLPCGIGSNAIFNQGACVLLVYEQLVSMGYSVGIVLAEYCDSKENVGLNSVVVKKPYDYLDENRLAFALCASDMFRRMFFALREQNTDGDSWEGYGGCCPKIAPDETMPADSVINFDPDGGRGYGFSVFGQRWGEQKAAARSLQEILESSGLAARATH